MKHQVNSSWVSYRNLGNVRVVTDGDGTVEQVNHYYAFGGLMGDSSGGDVQKYKYNGKELDRFLGWDMLDYGARWYDSKLQCWSTVDPLAEKYYHISPYVYCFNNPLRFVDEKGKEPGDYFESIQDAALDFGKCYNVQSIKESREYASFIYMTHDAWGNIAYSYMIPNGGDENSSEPNLKGYSYGGKIVADIHSHGDYVRDKDGNSIYDDNHFSESDIKRYHQIGKDGYVVTPDGSLLHYSLEKRKVSKISNKMPKSSGRTKDGRKIISNISRHGENSKTSKQRREIWYEQRKNKSLWDRLINSFLIPQK